MAASKLGMCVCATYNLHNFISAYVQQFASQMKPDIRIMLQCDCYAKGHAILRRSVVVQRIRLDRAAKTRDIKRTRSIRRRKKVSSTLNQNGMKSLGKFMP